jgi:MFS family permease
MSITTGYHGHEIMPLEESGIFWNALCMEQAMPVQEVTMGRVEVLPEEEHRAVRFAASVLFLADGIAFGTWAALLPTFKQKFGLDEQGLGNALLAMVIGALIGMPLVGRGIARWGTRRILRFAAPAFCLYLAVLAWVPSYHWFVAAAFGFGGLKGAFDVANNSQAIAVENAGRSPIMSTFQALWSIGGGLASLAVGMALKRDLSPAWVVITVSLVLTVSCLAYSGRLIGGDSAPPREGKTSRWPGKVVLRIGALAFLVLFAEGVMMDWSAVYTRSVAGASDWLAPLAFGAFSVAMATGRLLGDRVTARVGPVAIVRYGGILLAAGMLIVVGIHHWPATFIGLILVGFGLSNQVPVLFGAAGRAHHGGVGEGIAAVSTIGWLGFLAGPPVVARIGHITGLPTAFSVVILFAIVLAAWGPRTLGQSAR